MSWVDFRNQALRDISSADLLYDSRDYGNSAYLLQQSIEKFIKSIVIRYELSTKSMQELGHMPLTKLWDDLHQRMNEYFEKSPSEIAKNHYQNMSESIRIIKDFFIDSTRDLKFALWKGSLKIPMSLDEEKTILEFVRKLQKELEPQIRALSHDYFELFEKKIKPFFDRIPPSQKQEIQNLLDVVKLDIDLNQLEKIQISTNADIDEFAKQVPIFFIRLETLYRIIRKNPRGLSFLESEQALVILFAWIFSFSTQILKIFAHETIGRYPTEIENRSSINWYEEKHEILKDLKLEISDACNRLNLMIFYKVPQH